MKFFKENIQRLSATVVLIISTGCSVFGIRNEEQPDYQVIQKQENKEIRKYAPHIIAKTSVVGTYDEAQSQGFRILAGYIFGKNKSKQKIDMTAPVVQKQEDSSQKIAMTAPVTLSPQNENQANDSWVMTFSMPSKFTMETLPTPDDDRVILEQVPARHVAALTFSGFWGLEKNKRKADELLSWLNGTTNFTPISAPMFAGYNPPWTLPFFRRNEMLIEVTQKADSPE